MARKMIGDEWLKYSLHVISRYKFPTTREPRSSSFSSLSSSSHYSLSSSSYSSQNLSSLSVKETSSTVYRRLDSAWTHVDDAACDCPHLIVGNTYLLVSWTQSSTGSSGGHGGLLLSRDSVVMPWRSALSRRLKRLARYEQRRGC